MRCESTVALACVVLASGTGCSCSKEPLPEIATVPRFSLVDQQGKSFESQQLSDRIWVANFMFTRCPTVCPALTSRTAGLRRAVLGRRGFPHTLLGKDNQRPAVHFVSFSVDPEHDRPDVLQDFAARYGADARDWHFLTGDTTELRHIIEQGLRVRMGEKVDGPNGMNITHGTHYVLVDPRASIRGYYRSTDEGGKQLLQAIDTLRSTED